MWKTKNTDSESFITRQLSTLISLSSLLFMKLVSWNTHHIFTCFLNRICEFPASYFKWMKTYWWKIKMKDKQNLKRILSYNITCLYNIYVKPGLHVALNQLWVTVLWATGPAWRFSICFKPSPLLLIWSTQYVDMLLDRVCFSLGGRWGGVLAVLVLRGEGFYIIFCLKQDQDSRPSEAPLYPLVFGIYAYNF